MKKSVYYSANSSYAEFAVQTIRRSTRTSLSDYSGYTRDEQFELIETRINRGSFNIDFILNG